MNEYYQWKDKTLVLFCHLQPKASKDEFAGEHGDRLKIRISAPPIDGKANSHLIKFISKQFAVAQSAVSISSGLQGRQKTLRIIEPGKIPESLNLNKPVKP